MSTSTALASAAFPQDRSGATPVNPYVAVPIVILFLVLVTWRIVRR